MALAGLPRRQGACSSTLAVQALLLLVWASIFASAQDECLVTYGTDGRPLLFGGVWDRCRGAGCAPRNKTGPYLGAKCALMSDMSLQKQIGFLWPVWDFGACAEEQGYSAIYRSMQLNKAMIKFSPCDLVRYLRGRTLWLMGDSHSKRTYWALQCLLYDFWSPQQECEVSPNADESKLLRSKLTDARNPLTCFHLRGPGGGRVCLVHMALASNIFYDGKPDNGTAPGANGTTPGANGTAPDTNGTTPGANGTAPGANGTTPGANGTAPGANETSSGTKETSSRADDSTPPEMGSALLGVTDRQRRRRRPLRISGTSGTQPGAPLGTDGSEPGQESGLLPLLQARFASPRDIFQLSVGTHDAKNRPNRDKYKPSLEQLGRYYQATKLRFPHVLWRETPAQHVTNPSANMCRQLPGIKFDQATRSLLMDRAQYSEALLWESGFQANKLANQVLTKAGVTVLEGFNVSVGSLRSHINRRNALKKLDCVHYCQPSLYQYLIFFLYQLMERGETGIAPVPVTPETDAQFECVKQTPDFDE